MRNKRREVRENKLKKERKGEKDIKKWDGKSGMEMEERRKKGEVKWKG